MSRIPIDPDSDVVEQHYAVIYSLRRHRDRFPDNCVTVVESEDAARAQAKPDKNFYAARVVGPSRSSEGYMLYYLENWLE